MCPEAAAGDLSGGLDAGADLPLPDLHPDHADPVDFGAEYRPGPTGRVPNSRPLGCSGASETDG